MTNYTNYTEPDIIDEAYYEEPPGNACYHHNENAHENVQYALEFISLLIIGSVGMVGNTLAIFMFSTLKNQLKFHRLMITISMFDNLFIIFRLIILAFPYIHDDYKYGDLYCHMIPIVTPLSYIALTGSIYSTMAISIERYLVVCHPFFTLSNKWSSKVYILPILVFSILYNVPRFFGLKVQPIAMGNPRNKSAINDPMFSIEHTDMRVDFYYVSIYRGWMNLFLMAIIPFVVLITLNILILKNLKEVLSTRSRQSVVGTLGCPGSLMAKSSFHPDQDKSCIPVSPRSVTKSNEILLAKVSVIIVLFFIVCHSVKWIPIIYGIIYEHYITYNNFHLPQWIEICKNVSCVLTVMNSSVNFYIYVITHFNVLPSTGLAHLICCSNGRSENGDAHIAAAIPLIERNGRTPEYRIQRFSTKLVHA